MTSFFYGKVMKTIGILILFLSGICLANELDKSTKPLENLMSIEINIKVDKIKNMVNYLQNSMSYLNKSLDKLSSQASLDQDDRRLILSVADKINNTANHLKTTTANLPKATQESMQYFTTTVQDLTNSFIYKLILIGALFIVGLGLLAYFTVKPLVASAQQISSGFNSISNSMNNIATISQKNCHSKRRKPIN